MSTSLEQTVAAYDPTAGENSVSLELDQSYNFDSQVDLNLAADSAIASAFNIDGDITVDVGIEGNSAAFAADIQAFGANTATDLALAALVASDYTTITATGYAATGTNAVPMITSADQGGTVAEIADGAPGENVDTHLASGAVTFSDDDRHDIHSASFVPQGTGYLGAFVLDAVDEEAGSVGWSFSIDDADIDHLQPGETLTQSYDVRVADGQGGVAVQTVTITITGAGDAPPIPISAGDDLVLLISGAAIDIDVLANDKGGGISLSSFDAIGSDGSPVTLNPDGTLHYVPNSVSGAFSYTIIDSSGEMDTATVTVLQMSEGTVTGTNGNNAFFFQGSSTNLSATLINPYSGNEVSVSGVANLNQVSYNGLVGSDTIFMTNISDALFIESTDGVQIVSNLEVFFAGNGKDIINLASASFTLGNIVIDGGGDDDILWSNAGNDTLNGREGADILDGGPGNDVVNGGANNTVIASGNDTLHGGAGADLLRGEDGNDLLDYSVDGVWQAGDQTVNAATGETASLEGLNRSFDIFDGGADSDMIRLTTGDDALLLDDSLSPFHPLGSSLRLTGVEEIHAGDGDDLVNLTHATLVYGDVRLYGGSGNDTLWTSSGADILNGGHGVDNLFGGAGADRFAFRLADLGFGVDQIQDLVIADGDAIDLSDLLTGFDPLTDAITDFLRISDAAGNSIVDVDVDGGGNAFTAVAVVLNATGLTNEQMLVDNGVILV